ncbi:hypothetical protein MOK15_21470 [Sphingobium sp. BYY-5]|uniref:hypothetical protein n=1 Tax=Sphingobium sp. BYY-5 TaxID=2926400 RepID=UPI001FA6B7C3|nr:hypothetical protein [Sphingobium sp. BYY-5]MCI4592630.1 hypothetical protein [Sphingobium sp. BYY-5]
MGIGVLTNPVADLVPLLGGPLNSLPWYLPPRSSANRSATTSSLAMGPGIFGSFGDTLSTGPLGFPRLARHYDAQGGTLADPEAAPILSLTPRAAIDAGPGYRLHLDADSGRIAVEHLDSGTQTILWGEGGPALAQESWFGLDNGTALAIDTVPAADHAQAFEAVRIDISRDGGTLSLHARD